MHHRKVSIISYMCITVFTHTHPDTHTRTHTHTYLMYMMRLLMLAHFKFSCSVVSNSAIYGLQHTRLPCSSPITRACSNSCLLSLWCYPSISSSVIPFSSFLQSFPTSFSSKSVLCIWWPKYWSFIFSISPSNEHSGLICFRMDWLGLLAVQGTLKSLLQHHIAEASILWPSALFILASSVWKTLQCLISTPMQGGEVSHLFRLACLLCFELACVVSVHSGWTTVGLPQPKVACAS